MDVYFIDPQMMHYGKQTGAKIDLVLVHNALNLSLSCPQILIVEVSNILRQSDGVIK